MSLLKDIWGGGGEVIRIGLINEILQGGLLEIREECVDEEQHDPTGVHSTFLSIL